MGTLQVGPRGLSRPTTGSVLRARLVPSPIFAGASFANRRPVSTARMALPEFSLKDQVVVVTGGAQGLGLVQAEAALEAGAIGSYCRKT